MYYNEESIDINPLGQIIVLIASSVIVANDSPAEPDTNSASNEV